MTLGIACTIFFALTAIYQTYVVQCHERAIQIYKKTIDDQRSIFLSGIEIRDRQLSSIAVLLPLHHAAAMRGDARQCNAILASAIASMNAIASESGDSHDGIRKSS